MRSIWTIACLAAIIAASTTITSCATAQPPTIIPPAPLPVPAKPAYPTLTPAELSHLTALTKADPLLKSALDKIARKDQLCRGYARQLRAVLEQTRGLP